MKKSLLAILLLTSTFAFARDGRKKENPVTIERAQEWVAKGQKEKDIEKKIACWDKAVRIYYFINKDSVELKELVWNIIDICMEQNSEVGDKLARVWLDRITDKYPDNEKAKKLVAELEARKKKRESDKQSEE